MCLYMLTVWPAFIVFAQLSVRWPLLHIRYMLISTMLLASLLLLFLLGYWIV